MRLFLSPMAGEMQVKEKKIKMNISHLQCVPVGVRFIEPAMTGVINALAQT
jgi:hypothetical protein